MMIRLVAPFVFVAAAGACASAPRGQEIQSVVHGRTSCAASFNSSLLVSARQLEALVRHHAPWLRPVAHGSSGRQGDHRSEP